jgi:hypothetical protein
MPATIEPERTLTPATSGFVLAAAITVVFNTALACAKDASPALKNFLKSLSDHDWTTQGILDLLLFVALGFIFANTNFARKINPNRLITMLIGAAGIAALGLALWYALF